MAGNGTVDARVRDLVSKFSARTSTGTRVLVPVDCGFGWWYSRVLVSEGWNPGLLSPFFFFYILRVGLDELS